MFKLHFFLMCLFSVIHFNLDYNFQKKSDEPIILTKNNIVALKQEHFKVTRRLIGLKKLPPEVPEYKVDLADVSCWAIREMWLHGFVSNEIVFNLKIDGRPFFGKFLYLNSYRKSCICIFSGIFLAWKVLENACSLLGSP